MYVLLLVLLNLILMVPLRIQTSVSIWSIPLGIPLIEKKSNKREKTKRQKRWNTETKKQHRKYKGERTSDEPGKTSSKLKRNEEPTVRKKRQEITKIRFVCVRGRRPWQGLRGVLEVP